jgi:hypothetical protein
MAQGRLAGIAYLYVDGNGYPLVGDFSYGVASVKRETLPGMDRIHGFKETPIPGFIEGKVRDAGAFSVASVNAQTAVTVVAVLANGKTITLGAGWTVGEGEKVESEDGSFEVRWESDNVTEATSAGSLV